ncbi:MAG: macro domain-containing protein [Candidatus Lokiarchaeota archaeon]|nr:macro domain-containing protein [Candidatus Lokiarchaeota archaeon]
MDQIMINNSIVEIFIGDLTNIEQYDAIVIPTNSRLLPSGDLRCKVLRKAGTQVQVECNQIINKIIQIPVGKSIVTSGGNFINYIIHTNGPRPGQGNEGKKLMLATWNSLILADEIGVVSVVFPPISIEMRGITSKLCAEAMLPTIKKYIVEKNQNLRNISVCLEIETDYKEFEKVLQGLSG